MKNKEICTKDMIYIVLAVATMIAGRVGLYQLVVILFSAYATASALIISKILIGGVFVRLQLNRIAAVTFNSLFLGVAGALYTKRILDYLNKNAKSSYNVLMVCDGESTVVIF